MPTAAYKQMLVDTQVPDDIVYSNLFTGVHGNLFQSPGHQKRRD